MDIVPSVATKLWERRSMERWSDRPLKWARKIVVLNVSSARSRSILGRCCLRRLAFCVRAMRSIESLEMLLVVILSFEDAVVAHWKALPLQFTPSAENLMHEVVTNKALLPAWPKRFNSPTHPRFRFHNISCFGTTKRKTPVLEMMAEYQSVMPSLGVAG